MSIGAAIAIVLLGAFALWQSVCVFGLNTERMAERAELARLRARIAQLELGGAAAGSLANAWRRNATQLAAQLREARESYKTLAWKLADVLEEGSAEQKRLREYLARVEADDLMAAQGRRA